MAAVQISLYLLVSCSDFRVPEVRYLRPHENLSRQPAIGKVFVQAVGLPEYLACWPYTSCWCSQISGPAADVTIMKCLHFIMATTSAARPAHYQAHKKKRWGHPQVGDQIKNNMYVGKRQSLRNHYHDFSMPALATVYWGVGKIDTSCVNMGAWLAAMFMQNVRCLGLHLANANSGQYNDRYQCNKHPFSPFSLR